jgi:putative tryptophan/tyrosine transport system substrate-binding protein
MTNINIEIAPKRLELLHEFVPTATIMGLLVNPINPTLAEPTTRGAQTSSSQATPSIRQDRTFRA